MGLSWSAAPPPPPALTWKVCWGCWGPRRRSEQACGCHREAESVSHSVACGCLQQPHNGCVRTLCLPTESCPLHLSPVPSSSSKPPSHTPFHPKDHPRTHLNSIPSLSTPSTTHHHGGASGSRTWECGSQSRTWGSGTHTWGSVRRSTSSHLGALNPCSIEDVKKPLRGRPAEGAAQLPIVILTRWSGAGGPPRWSGR